MLGLPHLTMVLFGLAENGTGMEAVMFIPAVIGRIRARDMFTLAADGIMARMVTGGTEVIGDNFDVQMCGYANVQILKCADADMQILKLKQGLNICTSAYIHI